MTGNALKKIAMISMLIDHAGFILVWSVIAAHPEIHGTGDDLKTTPLVLLYLFMRIVGRIAFPIFIYLLIEGFKYTHNRINYFVRLLLFAFVSEVPFDLAMSISTNKLKTGHIIEFGYQNVFFTLALGLLAIIIIDTAQNVCSSDNVKYLICGFSVAILLLLAYGLQTDYDVFGVLAIILAYTFRENRMKQMFVCVFILSVASVMEIAAFACLPIIAKYNGERGRGNKWVFYCFYPVHLLLLVGIRVIMGY